MSEPSVNEIFEQCADYLAQGDVFAQVPLVELSDEDDSSAIVLLGPAVLMNHGCALDKRNKQGSMTIERVTFARLRSTEVLGRDAARSLRTAHDRLQPYEALYLGEVSTFGECFVRMGDLFTIPVRYFDPELREFPAGDATDISLVARRNDTRLGRLNEAQRSLLYDKWTAYWTRRVSE